MGIDYTKRPKPDAGATPQPGTPAGAPAPAGGGISLSKVTLTKAAPTVSLTKQGSAQGVLRVNLNWTARPPGQAPSGRGGMLGGLFGGGQKASSSGAIDLDLAALYEYTDGSKGAVQALGNAFSDQHSFGGSPIVWLDGDDRSGTSTGGENLYVDLGQSRNVKRILVFAFIYEGTPNWQAANAVVTLYPASGPEIEVRLDEHDPRSPLCAIAMLENVGGDLSVRREVRYIQGSQRALDEAYGWGMRWAAGRK